MTSDWTPELTLNHELLDRQHVEIFRRLQEAVTALDGPRAGLEAAVARLGDALVDHVATEERIMDEALYPERVRHRTAHEMFLADFGRLRGDLGAHGPTTSVAEGIRVRIPEWLRFHILVNDQPLGLFLARRHGPGPRLPKDDGRRPS